MIHKRARVEFHPLGVIGAIVSWNYPFHNIFNPMLAALFSGNGIVIKVSNLIVPSYPQFFPWMYSVCLDFVVLDAFNYRD